MSCTERIGCQRCGEDKETEVYDVGSQQAELCDECAERVSEIISAMDEWRERVTDDNYTLRTDN